MKCGGGLPICDGKNHLAKKVLYFPSLNPLKLRFFEYFLIEVAISQEQIEVFEFCKNLVTRYTKYNVSCLEWTLYDQLQAMY